MTIKTTSHDRILALEVQMVDDAHDTKSSAGIKPIGRVKIFDLDKNGRYNLRYVGEGKTFFSNNYTFGDIFKIIEFNSQFVEQGYQVFASRRAA